MGRYRSKRKRSIDEGELRAKLQDRLPGKEIEFIESPDGVKMSEVLEAFIEPYAESIITEESMNNFVAIAAMAWNISLLPKSKRKAAINALLNSQPPAARADAKSILAELLRRKRKYFAEYRRAIVEFKVTDLGDSFHLSVASTPGDFGIDQ